MSPSPPKIVRGSLEWSRQGNARSKTKLAAALGNFDGVHRGHQVILKGLVRKALKNGMIPAVYTFDPHPAKILAPRSAPPLLQTVEQKIRALRELGVRVVVLEPFTRSFAKLKPETFFKKILMERLNAKALWAGYNFTFGVKRSGSIELLKNLCRRGNVELHVTKAQFYQGSLVSSTQIRNFIQSGKADLARKFLGRPFALTGRVVPGAGIGGPKLGIHTANLKWENDLLPKPGIYVTRTHVGRKSWPSATSVGFNPTFPGKGFSVETHLIGFRGNLRGKKIEIAFLKWLREELAFPNPETLAAQIQKDIAEAKKFNETLRHHR